MKLMIDIPKKVVTAIQNGEDYRYDIHTAIAQGIPYEERPQGDLISRSELRKHVFTTYQSNGVVSEPLKVVPLGCIDNAPTVEEKPQAENALLMDIAHSLAIIADNSTKNGNTQESGNGMLRWVHSEAHRVMCPKCGCRVSMTAAYEMNYCFKCGAKLGGIKNND